ncbi:hypothetical protein JW898_00415 [Candidatus Woesearchaeota archaeon]|nr:hypothetical protein [Candidatus Woesearchaeota archaeon]
MGLIEKLQSELSGTDYIAKECIETLRQQLEWQGVRYCMLSHVSLNVYCPLQGGCEEGVKLARCLRDDYMRELVARNPSRNSCADKG